MTAHSKEVGVVGMETLNHKAGGGGGKEKYCGSVHFSHIDPILSDDAMPRGQWGWVPCETY